MKKVIFLCLIIGVCVVGQSVFAAKPQVEGGLGGGTKPGVPSLPEGSAPSPSGGSIGGAEIPKSGEVAPLPSGFDLFVQDVKQTIDIFFTFDDIEKVKKQLRYAKENIDQAANIAETHKDDPTASKRVTQIVEDVGDLMSDIQETQTDWLQPDTQEMPEFLNQIIDFQLDVATQLQVIEEQITPEAESTFADLSQEIKQISVGTLTGIKENVQDHPQIPSSIQTAVDTTIIFVEKIEEEGSFIEIPALTEQLDPAVSAALKEKIESLQELFLQDKDRDGILNEEEKALGTSEVEFDSDFDGLNDKVEVDTWKTNPTKADTDGDGFSDGVEVLNGYDPLK